MFTLEQQRLFDLAYNKALQADEDSKLVGLTDFMLKMLVQSGNAVERDLHCMAVVPHVLNRGGALMDYRKCYSKGGKILGVGFSPSRCDPSRAVCFQAKNGFANQKFIQRANLCPYFATFESHKVEGESVGCGHLNQFLCAVYQELEVPPGFENNTDLLGTSGKTKLNKHDICQRDAAVTGDHHLHNAVDKGLKWTFIYEHIAVKYSELPNIFQKALNVEHHIGEGETWDEQLGAIARSIIDHFSTHGSNAKAPDSKLISRQALSSKPPRAEDVPRRVL